MTATAQDNQIIAAAGNREQGMGSASAIGAGNRTMRPAPNTQYPTPNTHQGFTLLELLVVIALLAVLLTLIFKPLVDTFNLTSRAGTQVEAQAAARDTLREVTTTLSDAAYVYDNTSNTINLWIPTVGGQVAVPTSRAMIEYARPSKQYDQSPNLTTDPTTGDPLYPQTNTPKEKAESGYALPLTAGRTLGRLFIGLSDNTPTADASGANLNGMPKKPYFNTYEEPRVQQADNRYTLYRAEVQTFIADPTNPTTYIPNLKLFHTVDSSGNIGNDPTGTIQLHDPNFFYDSSPAGTGGSAGTAVWAVPGAKPTGNGGAYTIADNWRAVSSTLLLPKKVDAVALNRDTDSNAPLYYNPKTGALSQTATPGDVTRVKPLITFGPYYVENDPGTPASVENSGNEAIAPAAITYQTQYAHWDNSFRVQVFRAPDATGDPLNQTNLTYYEFDPKTGNILMNVAAYGADSGVGSGTVAGPKVDPVTGVWLNTAQDMKNSNFFAYSVDPLGGAVNFSFPWSVLCFDSSQNNAPVPQKYSPFEINTKMIDAATAGYEKRYLQLGVLSTAKWGAAQAPLMPAASNGTNPAQSPLAMNIFGTVPGTAPRMSIVAGSEQVFGPDQTPGPHYGYRTQYTRVSASGDAPGLNQYKINYTDVPNAAPAIALNASEPRVGMGYIEFDSINDTTDSPNIDPFLGQITENTVPPVLAGDPPLNYRPHSLPQMKNQGGVNVPSDPIEVTYRFQMNRPNDVVKADYLTRDLINVSMNVRYYDPRSSRPQEMNLTGQVKTRNLQR